MSSYLNNFQVDLVIVFRFADTSGKTMLTRPNFTAKAEASRNFQDLVQALARVGLAIEVRNGENCSLLVFVKVASDERLNNAVYRSRCAPRSSTSYNASLTYILE